MTKSEIKTAKDNEIITEYVIQFAFLITNFNTGKQTDRLEERCDELATELVRRGILTAEDVKRING